MDGGDDFYTGGPAEGGVVDAANGDGAPEGYADLGGGDYGTGGDYAAFDPQQSSVNPEPQSNGYNPGVGGFTQGYTSLDEQGDDPGMGLPAPEDVQPSALDDFMRSWQETLEEKAAIESQAKAAALEAAKADLETHGLERAAKKDAKMVRNREQEQIFLEQLEGELESENPWERVVSMVDTQVAIVDDFKDKSRMTSILIQLKNDPLDQTSTRAAAS